MNVCSLLRDPAGKVVCRAGSPMGWRQESLSEGSLLSVLSDYGTTPFPPPPCSGAAVFMS